MKNTLLIIVCGLLSFGLKASTESEVSVYRLTGTELEPITVKLQMTSQSGDVQSFSTHDAGRSYFELDEGEYMLSLNSAELPNFQVPLTIESSQELNYFYFSIIVADMTDAKGNVIGTQINSFHKRPNHQIGEYVYSETTERMIQAIESARGQQSNLLINSSVYYTVSPSEIRDLISAGDYAMSHDEVSNVYYFQEGEFGFLNSSIETQYASVSSSSVDYTGIADAKSFTTFAEVTEVVEAAHTAVSESGQFFSVQKGIFRRAVKARDGEFIVKTDDGLSVLCSGEFTSYQEAKALKEQLLSSGEQGVFVIGFMDGKKVSVQKLMN